MLDFQQTATSLEKLVHCTNKSRAKIPNEVNVIGINFQKCTPPQILFFSIYFCDNFMRIELKEMSCYWWT